MAGLAAGYDSVVVRGRMADNRFGIYYFRSGVLIAVDTVNRPGDHLLARKLIATPDRVSPAAVANESVELRSLVA